MNKSKQKRLTLLLISILILLLDQISKNNVLSTIDYNESFVLIPKVIKISLVKNTGAAFSILRNSTYFLTFTSLIVSAALVINIWKFPPKSKLNTIGLPFLLGGTLGNGVDRLLKGYVIDFIEFIPLDFPIFNVADIAINIGIFFIILELIKQKKPSLIKK